MPQPTQAVGGTEHGLPDRFGQIEGGNRDPVITKPTTSINITQPFLPRNVISDVQYKPDEDNPLYIVNDNGIIANNIYTKPRSMIYYKIGKEYNEENAIFYRYPWTLPVEKDQLVLAHQAKLHKIAWRPLMDPEMMNTQNYFAFMVGENTRNRGEYIAIDTVPDIISADCGILLFIPSYFASPSQDGYRFYDSTSTDTFFQKNPVRTMTSFTCNDENGNTWDYPQNTTFFNVCWRQKTFPENITSQSVNKAYIVGTQRINNAFRPKVYEIIVGNFTNAGEDDADPQFEIKDISPSTNTINNAIFWSCSYEETENKLYVTGQLVNNQITNLPNPLLPFFEYDVATETWTNLSTVTNKTAANIVTGSDIFLQQTPNGTYLVSKTTDFSTLDIIKGDAIIIADTTSNTYPIPEQSRLLRNKMAAFTDPEYYSYLDSLMLDDNGIFQIEEISGNRLKVDKKMFLYNFRFGYLSADITTTDTTISLIARYHVDSSVFSPTGQDMDYDFLTATIFPAPVTGTTNSIIIDEEIIEYSAVTSIVNTVGINAGYSRIETYTLTISQRGANGTEAVAHKQQRWETAVVTPESPEDSNYAILVVDMPFIISNKFNDIEWRPDMLTSLITGNRGLLRYDKSGYIYDLAEYTLPPDINTCKIAWKDETARIIVNTNAISYAIEYTGAVRKLNIVSYTILNAIAFNSVNANEIGGSKLYTLSDSSFTIPATNPIKAVPTRNAYPQSTLANYWDSTNNRDIPQSVNQSQLISIEDIKSDTINVLAFQRYNTTYDLQSGMVNYIDVFLYPYIIENTPYIQPLSGLRNNLERWAVFSGRYILYDQSNKACQNNTTDDYTANQSGNLLSIPRPTWAKYISFKVILPYINAANGQYQQSVDIIIVGQEG